MPYIQTIKNTFVQQHELVTAQQQHIDKRSFYDILFEKRNKKYGAYELRRAYYRHLLIGLAFSISVLVLGLLAPYVVDLLRSDEIFDSETKIVDINPMPMPPGALQPEYIPPQKIEVPENLPPKVVTDSVPEEKPKPVIKPKEEVNTDEKQGTGNGSGGGEGNGTGTSDEVYFTVDALPVPPGGSLSDYLSKNLRYPEREKTMNVQGKVIIGCIINKDGSLEDVKVVSGVSDGLNNEALRVVKNMPAWKPGMRQGQPVRMYVRIPINFTMKH